MWCFFGFCVVWFVCVWAFAVGFGPLSVCVKVKGRGKGRGKGGKFREVEEGEEPCEAEESQEPEVEQEGGNQAAMVVKSFAVKTGSDAGGPKGATGTSSTDAPPEQHIARVCR